MLRVRNQGENNFGGHGKNPFFDSPGSDSFLSENLQMNQMKTPGSDKSKTVSFESSSSEIMSPPKIKRIARVDHPPVGKIYLGSPCDSSTWATSVQSHEVSPAGTNLETVERKNERKTWVMSSTFRKKIKSMTKAIPKLLQAMQGSTQTKINLTELTIATLTLTPRNGAGMEEGRKPFERMRTSLMLHLIQHNGNKSWTKVDGSKFEGEKVRKQKGQIAKLNNLLYDCIDCESTSFSEKTQDVVRIAKDAKESLEEIIGAYQGQSFSKRAMGQLNITCLKLLSGMYRDIVSSYEANDNNDDGLMLMVAASAYYALGKFETSLTLYHKAGTKLKEKVASSPEYIVHCAKLFNNMGCVYYEMKKYEKAMQTFQRALQLFHDDNEENYAYWVSAIMDQASILNNMAYALIKFKQYDDASDLLDASFELQQLLPGNVDMMTNATMTVSTMSSMAFVYLRTKKYKLALDTYSACAQLQAKNATHNDSDKVDILKKMIEICQKVKNHEKRVQLLRCVLLYQQTYLTEDDDEIWETNASLGEALQALAEMEGASI